MLSEDLTDHGCDVKQVPPKAQRFKWQLYPDFLTINKFDAGASLGLNCAGPWRPNKEVYVRCLGSKRSQLSAKWRNSKKAWK